MSVDGSRQGILRRLKLQGAQTPTQLSDHVGISIQAIGQHLAVLRADGLVRATSGPREGREGRPSSLYELTEVGEATFPKQYQALVVLLIDAIGDEMGSAGLQRILEAVTRTRIDQFKGLVEGLSLRERIEVLRSVYQDGDPYIDVAETSDGFLITERNCPFLQVAMKRPALCSTTVSVLRQVLGVHVERVRRFQDGHGCCSFRVYADRPISPDAPVFAPEPPRKTG